MGDDFLVSKDDASTLLRGFRIDGFQYWQVTILIMSKFVGLFLQWDEVTCATKSKTSILLWLWATDDCGTFGCTLDGCSINDPQKSGFSKNKAPQNPIVGGAVKGLTWIIMIFPR